MLHNAVYPVVLAMKSGVPSYAGGTARYVAIRFEHGEAASVIDAARRVWGQLSDLPFVFSMLADDLVAQYGAESRLAGALAAFAGLAVLIAVGAEGLKAASTHPARALRHE